MKKLIVELEVDETRTDEETVVVSLETVCKRLGYSVKRVKWQELDGRQTYGKARLEVVR